jgi:hypothetical protein
VSYCKTSYCIFTAGYCETGLSMAINKISDTTLRALKSDATTHNGKSRLDDGGGLYLLLAVKGGGRAWRLDYTINGKRKTISLGKHPDTTLKVAREFAEAARKEVAAEIDPSEARKADKPHKRCRYWQTSGRHPACPRSTPLSLWRVSGTTAE